MKAFAMNREYSDIRRCALAFGDRSERIYYLGFVDGRTYGQKGVLPMPGNVTGPLCADVRRRIISIAQLVHWQRANH